MSGLEAQTRAEGELQKAGVKSLDAHCAEAGFEVRALRALANGEELRVRGCAGALGNYSMQSYVEGEGELCAIPFVISGSGQYQLMVSELIDGYVVECAMPKSYVLAASGADGIFFVPQAGFKEFTSVVRMFSDESGESPRYLLSQKALGLPVSVLALSADARAALKY
jgi:hypothetical protein